MRNPGLRTALILLVLFTLPATVGCASRSPLPASSLRENWIDYVRALDDLNSAGLSSYARHLRPAGPLVDEWALYWETGTETSFADVAESFGIFFGDANFESLRTTWRLLTL